MGCIWQCDAQPRTATPLKDHDMLDQAEGTMQNIAGKVQDAFGAATGDAGTQAEGKARQVAGKAQAVYGDMLDTVRESAVTNPLGTMAMVAGVGFVLGALWSRR
jgi:uncharacterized protein YjbJ (UPF0337 family)